MKRKHQLAVVLGPVIAVIVAGVVLHVNNNRLRTGAETVLSAGEPGDRPAQGTDVYTDATASRASGDPNGTGRTSSHPSVKPVDAAARHDNGTAEKEDPTVLDDLPLPDFGDTTNEELQDAVQRTLESVRNAKSLQDGAQYLEAFLRKYPLGSSTAVMMNQLAGIYRDLRRFDDAKRILQHAKVLVGNDRFANTLELTEASIDFAKRDFVRMEARLQLVMGQSIPKSMDDPYAVTPQCFKAPALLAKMYAAKGNTSRADQVLKKAAERGMELVRENPTVDWLPSHVAELYWNRIVATLAAKPADKAAAYLLAKEAKECLPSYQGPWSYSQMISMIDLAKASRQAEGNANR